MCSSDLSEDWTFCENWRDLGGQIWVDKRVLLRHTGTYVFDGQSQDKLYEELHKIVLSKTQPTSEPTPPEMPLDVPHVIDPAALQEPQAVELASSPEMASTE